FRAQASRAAHIARRADRRSAVPGSPLDWITHRPDLPIMPGDSTNVGLGLWNSVPATLIVESAMFAAGVWVYARATRARRDRPCQLLDLRRRAVPHLRRERAWPAAARRR